MNSTENQHPFLQPESEARKIADLKMQRYLATSLPILLLGERGTGKSFYTNQLKQHHQVLYFDCLKFKDPFHFVKDYETRIQKVTAQTPKGKEKEIDNDREGADENNTGNQEPRPFLVFWDNVDCLNPSIQTILTNELRDLKSEYHLTATPQFKHIFASTRNRVEIREILSEYFYDLISFQIVEFPAFRLTRPDRQKDWESVWKQIFDQEKPVPSDPKLLKWLKEQTFPDNFRDLERVAIHYHTFKYVFTEEEKKMVIKSKAKSFDYVKQEYERYHAPNAFKPRYNFSDDSSLEEMMAEYKKELATWAINRFNSAKKAEAHFKQMDQKKGTESTGTSERSLYKWRNGT